MSLAEKFPGGFPERLNEGGLVFLREESYGKDSEEMTAQRLMTVLYNLVFYNSSNRQFYFSIDEDSDVVRVDYKEEEKFGDIGGVLNTAYVYFRSRRNLDETFRGDHRPVIGMFIEFHYPLPEANVYRTTVYRSPISRAAIYVAPELKSRAEEAFGLIDKLRQGEPVTLD